MERLLKSYRENLRFTTLEFNTITFYTDDSPLCTGIIECHTIEILTSTEGPFVILERDEISVYSYKREIMCDFSGDIRTREQFRSPLPHELQLQRVPYPLDRCQEVVSDQGGYFRRRWNESCVFVLR